MECKDEAAVERQKLVTDDGEIDDDQPSSIIPNSAPKTVIQTPISPVLSSKIFSSGDTSRTQDSSNCSVGRGGTSESGGGGGGGGIGGVSAGSGQYATRLIYVNERKYDAKSAEAANKSKARKAQREGPTTTANADKIENTSNVDLTFEERPLKHHSFISEVPDVRHMERALLGLLEDFHSGKLKAFGSGCTMEQMTDIREQQESLARLHFELGAGGDPLNNSNSNINAQDNMTQLVQKLENLSVSIEKLHSTNSNL